MISFIQRALAGLNSIQDYFNSEVDPEWVEFFINLQMCYVQEGYSKKVAFALAVANLEDDDAEFERLKRENPLPAADHAEVPFHQDLW